MIKKSNYIEVFLVGVLGAFGGLASQYFSDNNLVFYIIGTGIGSIAGLLISNHFGNSNLASKVALIKILTSIVMLSLCVWSGFQSGNSIGTISITFFMTGIFLAVPFGLLSLILGWIITFLMTSGFYKDDYQMILSVITEHGWFTAVYVWGVFFVLVFVIDKLSTSTS